MYPDFLVIGAQKAGTTWLDRNLRTHPQIWLPPEKEIHFFDLPRPLPFAALLLAPVRAARHWAKARLERDWAKVKAGEQSLGWYLWYYFLPRTHRWYRSLFTPSPGQICGESTPRYATLPEAEIKRIHRKMPDLKIIYLLRDPIDRMWSDLAMFQGPRFGGGGLRNSDKKTVRSFLSDRANLAHSMYSTNLNRWRKFYPGERIYIGYTEEIQNAPQDLLQNLYSFLGADPNEPAAYARANEKINSKKYPPIRRRLAHQLASRLANDTKDLHRQLRTKQTAAWMARNQDLMAPPTLVPEP
jgi:hypothetical protein